MTPPRRRSRYAPDREVERAFKLMRDQGFEPKRLKLGADGSIELDSGPAPALTEGEGSPDDALDAWKRQQENGPARRQ